MGFPGGSAGKESAYSAGDVGLIPGLGGSPGEGNGYPLQYSGLGNFMDRGAWKATVHGVEISWTGLSDKHIHFYLGKRFLYVQPMREFCMLLDIPEMEGGF